MSIQAAIGISQAPGTGREAGREAVTEAFKKIDGNADLVIVFASSHYNQTEVLAGVRETAGDALVVGSSSAGEITNMSLTLENSVVLMALQTPELTLFPMVSSPIADGSREAGEDFAEKMKKDVEEAGKELSFVMIFPDALAGNGADMVRGMIGVFGPDLPLVGGAPGDNQDFKKTYQYLNDEAHSGRIVGVGFSGKLNLGIGVRHGWLPIGVPMVATKSDGATLYEIDGKPALDVYRDYFGETNAELLTGDNKAPRARSIITYPIGLMQENGDIFIRTPLNINEDGSIQYAAEVPQGANIHIMIGSKDEAIEAAKYAAGKCLEGLDGVKPEALVIFNCIGRKTLFGEKADDEIKAIQEVLGAETPLIGFYTYGEQAPVDGVVKHMERCNNAFHNQTIVICALA